MSVQHSSNDLPENVTRRRALTLVLAAGAGVGAGLAGARPARASATRLAAPAGAWTDVPVPAETTPQLWGVAAPTPFCAFAIGQYSWEQRDVTTALHWNGRAWATQPVPPLQWNWFMDMTAASPRAAWVTGLTLTGQAPAGLYWNGSRWREAPLPTVGAGGGLVTFPSVAAEPGGTAWAVFSEGPSPEQSSVLRFERGAWVRRQGPELPEGSLLLTVAVRSPWDVWVGAANPNSSAGSETFHWDGQSWSRFDLPVPTEPFIGAMEILPVSRREIWAYVGSGSGSQQLCRFDGTAWVKVTAVPRLGMFPMAYGGDLVSDRNGGVWLPALGESVGSGHSGYLHWDGTEWSRVLGPARDTSLGFIEARDMAAIPGTRSIWAVGVQGTGYAPFIERFTPA